MVSGWSPKTWLLIGSLPPRNSMSSVELTTYSIKWLAHTVYETNGVSPYIGWLRFIGLGLGLGLGYIKFKECVNHFLEYMVSGWSPQTWLLIFVCSS